MIIIELNNFVWCFCGVLFGVFAVFCLVFLRCFVWCFCGVLFGVFAVSGAVVAPWMKPGVVAKNLLMRER